jgi:hypothetical protein
LSPDYFLVILGARARRAWVLDNNVMSHSKINPIKFTAAAIPIFVCVPPCVLLAWVFGHPLANCRLVALMRRRAAPAGWFNQTLSGILSHGKLQVEEDLATDGSCQRVAHENGMVP